MVLVPAYIGVDGLIVPLRIDPKDWRGPDAVRVAFDPERPFLRPMIYVASAMLARLPAQPWLDLIERHEDLPMPHGLMAARVEHDRYDYTEQADAWTRLTGTSIDLRDAYNVGATFVTRSLAIPRTTFRKVMARLFELDAALQAGELEPRIDPSMPVPPPVPEPPEPVVPWTDEDWQYVEEQAQRLDAQDPLTDDLADLARARQVWEARRQLLDNLGLAWDRTRRGDDDLPGRCQALGLTTVLAYDAAATALMAYVDDPARRALIAGDPPATPYLADVSVDLFRLPAPPTPPGLDRHAWLAQCEAAFLRERGAPDKQAGDLFTRVAGHRVRLRYRREAGAALALWRVERI